MKVRIGYGLGALSGVADAAAFAALVDGLEQHGFDSLWLSERVSGPAPDPIIGLAVAAGRTRRLKFGTSVQVLPGRNPALLAKELASLDVLSGGRLLPAFGLGVANGAEQQAFGVSREARAPWFDEALPLIRRIWTEDAVDHAGERFHYEGLRVLPKPVQQPLDVWLGGRAKSELRRVGRLGDGWLASFATPADCAAGRPVIEAAAAGADRAIDPEHFGAMIFYSRDELPAVVLDALRARNPHADPSELVLDGTGGSIAGALAACVEAYLEVGVSKFVLVPLGTPANWDDELGEAAAVLSLQT
jgi:probable F420-dependent oxidoreductase